MADRHQVLGIYSVYSLTGKIDGRILGTVFCMVDRVVVWLELDL